MFHEALIDIVHRLERAKQNGFLPAYALIGGFAAAAWGLPRATQDIDFALDLGGADPSLLAGTLGGEYCPGAPDDPLAGVITLSVQASGQAVPIELASCPPCGGVRSSTACRDFSSLTAQFLSSHGNPSSCSSSMPEAPKTSSMPSGCWSSSVLTPTPSKRYAPLRRPSVSLARSRTCWHGSPVSCHSNQLDRRNLELP